MGQQIQIRELAYSTDLERKYYQLAPIIRYMAFTKDLHELLKMANGVSSIHKENYSYPQYITTSGILMGKIMIP